ncbi:MAG: hypothetical protein ACF8XB_03770, partial [Planctomycetota bacterium JB042]
MLPLLGPSALLGVVVAALADDGPEAWVRRIERRVEVWRGAPVAPPVTVETVAADRVDPAGGREPPRGFLGHPEVVLAFGLVSFLDEAEAASPRAGRAAAAVGDRVVVATGASGVVRRLDLVDAVIRAVVARRFGGAGDEAAPDDDAALARAALLEGEVRWLRSLVVPDLAAAIAEGVEETDDLARLRPTPPPLVTAWRRLLAEEGEAFVRAVHAGGGWAAVDRAALSPP